MNVTVGMETIGIGVTNVNYDWSSIVEVISDSSQKDKDELQEYFPEAYPIMQEIFDFYTGTESTLSIAEFSHALHLMKIYNANVDLDLIKNKVLECKRRMGGGERKGSDMNEEALTKEEYLAAMILVSRELSRGAKRSADR